VKWHTFTGLEVERPAPDFCLTSDAGDTVCDSVYRQRLRQVLLFPSGDSPADWVMPLDAFSDHARDYRLQDTVLLGLLPADAQTIAGLGRNLTNHFPLLADDGAKIRRAYEELLDGDAGTSHLVFVLDSFGAPYAAAVNANPADPVLFDQVEQWLAFIAIQCPE
jgi:peroxiredoxin